MEFQKYSDRVETAFSKMEIKKVGRTKEATGKKDVMQFLMDHPERIWWWSWELNGNVNSKGAFLSHRACARASDLALKHPDLVEDRRISRFKVYRAKLENIEKINNFLQP